MGRPVNRKQKRLETPVFSLPLHFVKNTTFYNVGVRPADGFDKEEGPGGTPINYLERAFRKDGRVRKTELYLGKTIPKNIDEVKRSFLGRLYREKWYPLLDSIKREFSKEKREMPQSAREKETEIFAVRFTYDTQRMEGSTLSLRETAGLLEKGISPKGKPVRDVKEAEAHKEIFGEMVVHKKDLSLQAILWWHKRLFQETRPDISGKIRQHQVAISGSRFMPPRL